MWRGPKKGIDLVETQAMDDFFDRLDRLNMAELMSMRAAWLSIDRPTHEAAWAAVREVGEREGLTREIDRVRKKAADWSQRGSDSIPYLMQTNTNWLTVKMDAEEAIVDAALVVALGDRLDANSRATLIAPWLRATDASEARYPAEDEADDAEAATEAGAGPDGSS
jgi:hypothetical protein